MGTTGMWMRKIDTSSGVDPLLLVVVDGNDRRTLNLDHFPFTVGRRVDRDLVMADPRVSRDHAQFMRENEGIFIVDEGSRHGTFVNGERVNRRKLSRNDRVEFGVQGGAYVLYHPDRSVSSAAQQLLSQFSSWKPPSGAASDFEMLNVFLEAARKLNTAGVLEDVLQTLLEAALRLTQAERGFVFLRRADGELQLAAGRNKAGDKIDDDSTISRSVLRDAAKSNSEFLVTDTDATGMLAGRDSVIAHNLHSVICIPLRKTAVGGEKLKEDTGTEDDVQGILYLDAHFISGKLSTVSHDILRTIASGAAALVENAALVQAEDAAKRYRQEMAIAAEIQQRLMAVTVPDVPYAKVNAVSYACKDIGGDFFDLIHTRKGLSLVVTDVSGKGVSAAVVASILQGMLYSHLARDSELPEMITAVNRFLCEKVGGQKYATLVVARMEPTGELEIINCGHVPPLIISAGAVKTLEEGNLPVGLIAATDFQAARMKLSPGDRLVMVTDGVTEAENSDGEFFGTERLEVCGSEGFAAIERAVTEFRGTTPLSDDCTITEMVYRG